MEVGEVHVGSLLSLSYILQDVQESSQMRSRYVGCQNCDPFLGTLDIRCRIVIGIRKI